MSALKPLPTGFASTLTEQQSKCLEELQDRMNKSEYAKDLARDPAGTNLLLQFLRATMKDRSGERIFQVDAAEQRLKAMFDWRREFNLEEVQDAVESGSSFRPENFELFSKLYPALDVVNEETGQLVRFLRFGRFISTIDTSVLSHRDWTRCFAYECFDLQNRLRKLSQKYGREISTYAVISDLHGISFMGVVSRVNFVKMMSAVASNNFPEMMGQTLLVRGPSMLPTIFNFVKPFIDKDVQAKFVLRSDLPMDLIEALIPLSTVPKEFGGTSDVFYPQCLHDTKNH